MRVIANAVGHCGRQIRQPGDEFDMPDSMKGSWFDPVPAPAQPAEAPAPKAVGRKTAAPKDGDLA